MTVDRGDREAVVTTDRRAANIAAFEAVMEAVNAGDGDSAAPYLDADVEYLAPWYDLRIRGRADLVRMFGALPQRFDAIDYRIDEVIPGADPDVIVVLEHGDHAVRGSDRRYQNDYVLIVRFQDGRIRHWVEYSNPDVYKSAVGS